MGLKILLNYFILLNYTMLILTFCDYNYLNLVEIWLKNILTENYLIISADEKTYNSLKKLNINTELHVKNTPNFWIYRSKIICSFINKGIDIIVEYTASILTLEIIVIPDI